MTDDFDVRWIGFNTSRLRFRLSLCLHPGTTIPLINYSNASNGMAYNHHQARASRYGGGGGGSSSGGPPRGALDDWAEWAARSLDVDLRATPLQNYIGEYLGLLSFKLWYHQW